MDNGRRLSIVMQERDRYRAALELIATNKAVLPKYQWAAALIEIAEKALSGWDEDGEFSTTLAYLVRRGVLRCRHNIDDVPRYSLAERDREPEEVAHA